MFKTPMKLQAVANENTYIVTHDLVYESEGGGKIIVPAGFHTNFASVPRCLKFYIDDNDWQIRSPSVVHDFLYSKQSKDYGLCRRQADDILFEAMTGLGMRYTKALLIYYTLRVFGGANWEKR